FMVLFSSFDQSNTYEGGSFSRQTPPLTKSRDTISKTRPIGSTLGEFELFKSSISSPGRTTSSRRRTHYDLDYGSGNVDRNHDQDSITASFSPSSATISKTTMNNIMESSLVTCNQLISSNINSMLRNVNPLSRNYSLFRNIVELRDIPRSIVSLQKTAQDLIVLRKSLNLGNWSLAVHDLRKLSKHIPDEYLSYQFGWRQLYNDVTDLLVKPAIITKQINFLLDRSGKDTSFRTKKEVLLPSTTEAQGFDYVTSYYAESQSSTTHRLARKATLRLVVNTNFEFPKIDLPKFRKELFLDKLGVYPTITDLYNLTPWSWLIDWFTGFGNYVQLMEDVSRDRRLINWGLITAELGGSLTTEFKSKSTSTFTQGTLTDYSSVNTDSENRHASTYDFKAVVRKNVANATSGLNLISDPGSLTLYQKSILGALLAQRVKSQKR
ncbi:maturation protein, partial [ssRNA phage Gerhypos.4_7]